MHSIASTGREGPSPSESRPFRDSFTASKPVH
jgi:hypothetical protein